MERLIYAVAFFFIVGTIVAKLLSMRSTKYPIVVEVSLYQDVSWLLVRTVIAVLTGLMVFAI